MFSSEELPKYQLAIPDVFAALRLWVVPRHEGVGLHSELEARRRALDPRRARFVGRERVVGAVDLDGLEEAGVPAEALLRLHMRRSVEAASAKRDVLSHEARPARYVVLPIALKTAPAASLKTAVRWPRVLTCPRP